MAGNFKEYSETYVEWMHDILQRREQGMGRTQSMIAMSGVKAGSDLWKRYQKIAQQPFNEELTTVREGFTGSRINEMGRERMQIDFDAVFTHKYEETFQKGRTVKDIQQRYSTVYGLDLTTGEALAIDVTGKDIATGLDTRLGIPTGDFTKEELTGMFDDDILNVGASGPSTQFSVPIPGSPEEVVDEYLRVKADQEEHLRKNDPSRWTEEEIKELKESLNVSVG